MGETSDAVLHGRPAADDSNGALRLNGSSFRHDLDLVQVVAPASLVLSPASTRNSSDRPGGCIIRQAAAANGTTAPPERDDVQFTWENIVRVFQPYGKYSRILASKARGL
jgi:hypothetical protein